MDKFETTHFKRKTTTMETIQKENLVKPIKRELKKFNSYNKKFLPYIF